MIKAQQLARLESLIAAGEADKFYNWSSWQRLAAKVKRLDNYECQRCKARGRYSAGRVVHHVKHLIDRPDLALSIYDPETGERQLETLCLFCHLREHPENLRGHPENLSRAKAKRPPLTVERWD